MNEFHILRLKIICKFNLSILYKEKYFFLYLDENSFVDLIELIEKERYVRRNFINIASFVLS